MDRTAALPTELAYLIQLHSSFLSALSLHYAHNGTCSPVDLHTLIPSITQLFKKRKVTTDDVQLCLGVLQESTPDSPSQERTFGLYDYSRGRVCIELEGSPISRGILDKHFDETIQLGLFQTALEKGWLRWKDAEDRSDVSRQSEGPRKRKRGTASEPQTPSKRRKSEKTSEASPIIEAGEISRFVAQLPRAAISLCSSIQALSPLKRRGEIALASLKKNNPRTPSLGSKGSPSKCQPAASALTSSASRKSSLLDRIRAKEAAAAASPKKQLSKEELARQSALSRAPEILDIVGSVSQEKRRGSSTASVSLTSLVEQIQQSVRTPIAENEVRAVIEILAEITEEYIKIVRTLDMNYVTFNHFHKPSAKLLQERITSAATALA